MNKRITKELLLKKYDELVISHQELQEKFKELEIASETLRKNINTMIKDNNSLSRERDSFNHLYMITLDAYEKVRFDFKMLAIVGMILVGINVLKMIMGWL